MSADSARVSVSVAVPPPLAFEVFTADIDRWWRRGPKFRNAGTASGFIRIEPQAGGRLFESFDRGGQQHVFEVGRILLWDPPKRLSFSWRNSNYAEGEQTEVEVQFASVRGGTEVTVVHRRLAGLRPDHPARHGLAPAEFVRMMGMWWADQLTSLRLELAQRRVDPAPHTSA